MINLQTENVGNLFICPKHYVMVYMSHEKALEAFNFGLFTNFHKGNDFRKVELDALGLERIFKTKISILKPETPVLCLEIVKSSNLVCWNILTEKTVGWIIVEQYMNMTMAIK